MADDLKVYIPFVGHIEKTDQEQKLDNHYSKFLLKKMTKSMKISFSFVQTLLKQHFSVGN